MIIKTNFKSLLGYFFKYLISFTLIYLIFKNIQWSQTEIIIKKAHFMYLFITIVLLFSERILAAYRWHILLKVKGIIIPFTQIFSITYIGNFFGVFLPSSLSIDIIRAIYIKRALSETVNSISSVIVDRVLGLFSLVLLGIFSLVVLFFKIQKPFLVVFTIISGFFLIFMFYGLQRNEMASFIKNRICFLREHKFGKKMVEFYASFLDYKKYPVTLIYSFILSLIVHFVRILYFYTASRAFGGKVGIFYFFILIPVVMILIQLPISIGGVGIREGALVFLLGILGFSTTHAFLTSFSVSVLTTLTSAVGGIFYVFYKTSVIPNPIKY